MSPLGRAGPWDALPDMPSNSLPDDPFIGLPTRRPEMAILVRCEEKSPGQHLHPLAGRSVEDPREAGHPMIRAGTSGPAAGGQAAPCRLGREGGPMEGSSLVAVERALSAHRPGRDKVARPAGAVGAQPHGPVRDGATVRADPSGRCRP